MSKAGPDSAPSFILYGRAMKKRFVVLGLLVVVLVLVIIGLCLWLPSSSKQPEHLYSRAAVATDAKHCSEIGR